MRYQRAARKNSCLHAGRPARGHRRHLLFFALNSGNPTSGTGLELKFIAAVVIGGGSLSGGRGTVLGTLAGTAIMGVIASGGTLLGLSNPTQYIALGVIVIVAVAVDQLRSRE